MNSDTVSFASRRHCGRFRARFFLPFPEEGLEMIDNHSPLCRKAQIQILLSEYNTLRSEVLQKSASATQIIGVALSAGSASLAAILGLSLAGHPEATYALIPFAVFVALVRYLRRSSRFAMEQAGRHLIGLEHRINDLARARLLRWESELGGLAPETRTKRNEYIYSPGIWQKRMALADFTARLWRWEAACRRLVTRL